MFKEFVEVDLGIDFGTFRIVALIVLGLVFKDEIISAAKALRERLNEWLGNAKPTVNGVPLGSANVPMLSMLSALQDMTAWAVQHGSPEVLAKITDLYRDLQATNAKGVK